MSVSIGGQLTGSTLRLPSRSAQVLQYTLNANATITLPSLNGSGGRLTLALTQDGTGGRVPSFVTGSKRTIVWADGSPSAMSIDTGIGVTTFFDFIYYENVIEARIVNGIGSAGGGGGGGTFVDVTDPDYGATGDGVTDDTAAINLAINDLGVGKVLYFPPGNYAVSSTLSVDVERCTIMMDGYLQPHGSFSDYLLELTKETPTDILDYQGGINIHRIRIDGEWQSRGMRAYYMDEGSWHDILLLRCKGTSLKMEGCRETAIHGLRIVSSLYREAFSTPSDWNNATTYNIGDRVRFKNNIAAWAGVGTYHRNYMAQGSDGVAYRSLVDNNINNDPTTDNVNWVWEPWCDYECLISHSNKTPITNNTNDGNQANWYWKRVYQDEACLDLNHDTVTNDGNNSLNFYGAMIRNCDNKTLVRLDDNRTTSSAVNHIYFYGAHIHYIESGYPVADVSEGQNSGSALRNFGQCVEIGRARNCMFTNCLIRLGNGTVRGVAVRMAGEQPGKYADLNRFIACDISGSAAGQMGFVTGQYVNQRNSNQYVGTQITLSGSGKRDIVDDFWEMPYNFIRHFVGSGTPEGAVTAGVGSMYSRTDGGVGTSLYIKTSGSGNTGWQAIPGTLTQGSIPFAGANGLLTQENTTLFWDAVNRNLGINTNAPASRVHAYRNDSDTAPIITVEQDDTGDASFQWLLTGTRAWVAGIDNSDSDSWKLAAQNDGFGTPLITVTVGGTVRFANNFVWDTSQDYFGVGIAAPQTKAHVYVNTATTVPIITAEQDDSGDCTFQWLLTGTRAWCAGIDNSDSDAWKLWNANDGYSGYFIRFGTDGKVSFDATITAGGTTTVQTIDKASGRVNIAATETSKQVNNSLVTTSSLVFATIATNDSTATLKNVVAGSGSFTINLTAAATAEIAVNFLVIN